MQYRDKASEVEVQAVQWLGGNRIEVAELLGNDKYGETWEFSHDDEGPNIHIVLPCGCPSECRISDWLVLAPDEPLGIVNNDNFRRTYEPVEAAHRRATVDASGAGA